MIYSHPILLQIVVPDHLFTNFANWRFGLVTTCVVVLDYLISKHERCLPWSFFVTKLAYCHFYKICKPHSGKFSANLQIFVSDHFLPQNLQIVVSDHIFANMNYSNPMLCDY